MSDCCPLCQATLEYRVGRGLALRRHPRGQMVCPFDQKRWHLNLETTRREIELCSDQARAAHLKAEFEDMLLQHLGHATHQHREPLETA